MEKDKRKLTNQYSLIPMYLMQEEAMKFDVPFHKNYEDAIKKGNEIQHPFEYIITESKLQEYLVAMREVLNNKNTPTIYTIPSPLYTYVMFNCIHLSAHYGGLLVGDFRIKSGDHYTGDSLGGLLGFVNRPVEYSKDEFGNISFKRGVYEER